MNPLIKALEDMVNEGYDPYDNDHHLVVQRWLKIATEALSLYSQLKEGEKSKEEILRHFLIGCFQGQREMDDFMCNKYEDVYAAMEEYASNCVMTYHSETQSKEGEDDWKERFIKWDSEPKTTKQIIEWIEANFALNEGKQAGVSGEQIWKLACNELLANIAWTFANPDNTAKADNNYDKVVFEALGETIQNFPVPIYPGDELPTIDSLRVKEAGERMKLVGEVERLKGLLRKEVEQTGCSWITYSKINSL